MSTPQIVIIVIIVIYTRPLWILRYKFRSTVYKEKNWKINFRPWFWKETKALFSNKYFTTKEELKTAKMYRIYLAGFFLLWLALKYINYLFA